MREIIARFKSKCAETGKTLNKGDKIMYDPDTKKAYHMDSNTAKEQGMYSEEGKPGNNHDDLMVQAENNAMYDNWYAHNYGTRPD